MRGGAAEQNLPTFETYLVLKKCVKHISLMRSYEMWPYAY